MPFKLYKHDPNWVPPLFSESLKILDPARNPFFRHSEARLFTAFWNGKPVGRISAHTNTRHNEVHNDKVGFFGFFETIDNQPTAFGLLDAASRWLRSKGLERIVGPASFTINDEYGMLLNGFDSPPVIKMTYNPPYYNTLLDAWGMTKLHDLFAYRMLGGEGPPPAVRAKAQALEKTGQYVFRGPDINWFNEEVMRMREIFNEAWSENWGAVPMTKEEFLELARELKTIMDPDLIFIAEKDGEPAGFSVTIPDMNEALIHINGKLFPFGLLKLLWYSRKIKGVRVLAMGVKKEHRMKGVDAVFYMKTYDTALKKGYKKGEMSWILESNTRMNNTLKRLGAEIYKTYRVYGKDLV